MSQLYITNKIKIDDFAEIMDSFKLMLVQDIIPHVKKVYGEELFEYYVEDIFKDCNFQKNETNSYELVINFINKNKGTKTIEIPAYCLIVDDWKDKITNIYKKEQIKKRENEYKKKKNEIISRAEKYCYYKKLEKDFELQPLTEEEKKIAISISGGIIK